MFYTPMAIIEVVYVCVLGISQQGIQVVEVVGGPHFLHRLLDLVLLFDYFVRRRNALSKSTARDNG